MYKCYPDRVPVDQYRAAFARLTSNTNMLSLTDFMNGMYMWASGDAPVPDWATIFPFFG